MSSKTVVVVGAGYVGLVTGACFAAIGHRVTCVDSDPERVGDLKNGRMPIYEPGLDVLVADAVAADRLSFSGSIEAVLKGADAVFIAVGTPPREADGLPDLSAVFAVAKQIGENADESTLVVVKSTVPIGTSARVEKLIDGLDRSAELEIASNPEFLREGSAIDDFMKPDRVVCGVGSPQAEALMRDLYAPLGLSDDRMVITDNASAEMIKYAANSFLATKVAFINEISDLCEEAGADVDMVARGMGLDPRIGAHFLRPGPGYGGSCFPKDILALVRTAELYGTRMSIVEAVLDSNERRRRDLLRRVKETVGNGDLNGLNVAILGVTFKANTDDVRESPALPLVSALLNEGDALTVYDPKANRDGDPVLDQVSWAESIP
ncbi:MAG: UDP-glucose/GDP-mannose dehydrogenase family protein, partial [Pseudomonadota bacterium]